MASRNSKYSRHQPSPHQLWYKTVKQELLQSEPQNICARSKCCQDIVNDCVKQVTRNLQLGALKDCDKYECAVQVKAHLKFLLDWPGLRVVNSPAKALKCKKDYEKKSKNWLNGRRAPNYGKTLFPFFVEDVERYLSKLSEQLIPNNQHKMKLYYDCLMYKVLAQLCGCSVALHEQAKKAPFFCKNSVERKGRLKEIFQSYAADHQYVQGFPSCFDEAIGFFDAKSNQFFQEYRRIYLGFRDPNNNNQQNDPNNHRNMDNNNNIIASNSDSRNSVMFWHNEAMRFKSLLEKEVEYRIAAEKDRDVFKNMALDVKQRVLEETIHLNQNNAIPQTHLLPSNSGNSVSMMSADTGTTNQPIFHNMMDVHPMPMHMPSAHVHVQSNQEINNNRTGYQVQPQAFGGPSQQFIGNNNNQPPQTITDLNQALPPPFYFPGNRTLVTSNFGRNNNNNNGNNHAVYHNHGTTFDDQETIIMNNNNNHILNTLNCPTPMYTSPFGNNNV